MAAHLLLIDDEQPFVETMAKRLGKRGYTVATALSGEDGLKALDADHSVDVVILDVKMPGMDGIETLKRIKAEHPLVEVLMLTGHATVASAIDGMKSGAYDYMMKPCDIDELLAKVGEAYDQKQARETRILEARARHIELRRGD
ncbi:response regulator [Pseudodesulfovibrio cashew]|uniref:Response regulator n=1 Tax=Pseudodesulfovibrio cashew TaxID=2678688 RepID=A0A6I6JJ50_9BACT|nr:response regulator [Pseudodesulfovibrio cashew]QGY40197.1 response regulator [Pseudodesulfovibrio cashew]